MTHRSVRRAGEPVMISEPRQGPRNHDLARSRRPAARPLDFGDPGKKAADIDKQIPVPGAEMAHGQGHALARGDTGLRRVEPPGTIAAAPGGGGRVAGRMRRRRPDAAAA